LATRSRLLTIRFSSEHESHFEQIQIFQWGVYVACLLINPFKIRMSTIAQTYSSRVPALLDAKRVFVHQMLSTVIINELHIFVGTLAATHDHAALVTLLYSRRAPACPTAPPPSRVAET
jgi:hypothetical protein